MSTETSIINTQMPNSQQPNDIAENISVAVIMSVYKSDCLEYLQQAVDSVLAQTYANLKLYIYVDGAIDNAIECYLNELANNSKVNIIKNSENRGLALALNTLIADVIKNNYDYIARMDSDDICRLERIAKQVSFMQNNPKIDVCGSFCREFGASFALQRKVLPTNHDELVNFSIIRCPFIHPTVMFRNKVFKDGMRYPENTSLTEDMALWLLLLSCGYVFANIDEILLDYRLNENTLNRRHGFNKGFNEFKIRFSYMIKLQRFSIRNCVLIFARLVFHIMPIALMKKLYKHSR